MLHIFGFVCYGSWRKFSCWNRGAFAMNLLLKCLSYAVATKELLNSTDEKSLVGQKPRGSQDTLTAAQTTRALWSRRFLPFSRSRDSCRYFKFEVICLSINLNFHWFTLFGNQKMFRCSPGPGPRFPNPQGHRFHDMVAKGNSASFEQALQELSQSKKRPFSVFFKRKHGRPWKNMFEKGCFQTFLGRKNDPWRQENGGVFFALTSNGYGVGSQLISSEVLPHCWGYHWSWFETAPQFSFFIFFWRQPLLCVMRLQVWVCTRLYKMVQMTFDF